MTFVVDKHEAVDISPEAVEKLCRNFEQVSYKNGIGCYECDQTAEIDEQTSTMLRALRSALTASEQRIAALEAQTLKLIDGGIHFPECYPPMSVTPSQCMCGLEQARAILAKETTK